MKIIIDFTNSIGNYFDYTNKDFCGLDWFNSGYFDYEGDEVKIKDTNRAQLTNLVEYGYSFFIPVEVEERSEFKLHDYVIIKYEHPEDTQYKTLDCEKLLEKVNTWFSSGKKEDFYFQNGKVTDILWCEHDAIYEVIKGDFDFDTIETEDFSLPLF